MCIGGESEREISKAVDGYGQIERDKRTEPLWVNLWAVKGGANCFCLFCFQKLKRERERESHLFLGIQFLERTLDSVLLFLGSRAGRSFLIFCFLNE